MKLDAVGFCGLDDSADLAEAAALSSAYPWIEWGVLLRPGHEGQARFASAELLAQIGVLARAEAPPLRLAGHLCGEDCRRVLRGDAERIRELTGLGFRRFQINPTEANDAGGWEPAAAAAGIRAVAGASADVEFILQVNDETSPLFRELFESSGAAPPPNLAALFDPSCGLGLVPDARPPPLAGVHCGYAGGISPETVAEQLAAIGAAVGEHPEAVWIDMETGVRSRRDGCDVFDLDRVRRVCEVVAASGVTV